MTTWADDAVFYHLYPLGLLDAPRRNDRTSPPEPRLATLLHWTEHIRDLGANAVYLGPVFESSTHGYDTIDYHSVDRRLGTAGTLRDVIEGFHRAGIRIVLDAVLNHVGRDFWAFRHVLERGASSPYAGWFANLRFGPRNTLGDPFTYDCWHGHPDLVKLDTAQPDVRAHLFEAVRWWLTDLGADGLRLDAADSIDPDFLQALSGYRREIRPEAWLLGETVHGDYRRWVNPSTLDSVTNYVAYKGLWSSLADRNYFEIAYTLERQFGPNGDYRGLPLYAFADNHDVDRVATSVGDPALLRPLYALLFTMPGIPSVYAGSEWGLEGVRGADDSGVRQPLDPIRSAGTGTLPDLAGLIARLAAVRAASAALRHGAYRQLHVAAEQLAFMREGDGERVAVLLNAAPAAASFEVRVEAAAATDLLDEHEPIETSGGRLRATVPARAVRIVRLG